jgi:hypothetical protein
MGKHPRPNQRGRLEQFINAKEKYYRDIYMRVSHYRSSKNNPPYFLNRDHGPIGC